MHPRKLGSTRRKNVFGPLDADHTISLTCERIKRCRLDSRSSRLVGRDTVPSVEGADAGPGLGSPAPSVFSTSWLSSALGGLVFRTALAFLVLAIMAAVFGSGSILPPATGNATLLFYLFLAGFVVALLLGLITGRKTAS